MCSVSVTEADSIRAEAFGDTQSSCISAVLHVAAAQPSQTFASLLVLSTSSFLTGVPRQPAFLEP